MQFWSNRYTTPGWIFLGSFIIICVVLGLININSLLNTQSGVVGIATVAVGIIGGLPLGFCIESIYFVFDRLFRLGVNGYINQEHFYFELLKILNDVVSKEQEPKKKHILERYVSGLKAYEIKDSPEDSGKQ